MSSDFKMLARQARLLAKTAAKVRSKSQDRGPGTCMGGGIFAFNVLTCTLNSSCLFFYRGCPWQLLLYRVFYQTRIFFTLEKKILICSINLKLPINSECQPSWTYSTCFCEPAYTKQKRRKNLFATSVLYKHL